MFKLYISNPDKEGEAIYASPKVVEIHDKMSRYQQDWGYKPTKMPYEPVDQLKPGLYTGSSDSWKAETAETLRDCISGVLEMENLIHQKFLFPEAKRQQFFDSNPV